MDIASIVGLVGCFALMFYGIVGSNGMTALFSFIDRDSILITFGGAIMCIVVAAMAQPMLELYDMVSGM